MSVLHEHAECFKLLRQYERQGAEMVRVRGKPIVWGIAFKVPASNNLQEPQETCIGDVSVWWRVIMPFELAPGSAFRAGGGVGLFTHHERFWTVLSFLEVIRGAGEGAQRSVEGSIGHYHEDIQDFDFEAAFEVLSAKLVAREQKKSAFRVISYLTTDTV